MSSKSRTAPSLLSPAGQASGTPIALVERKERISLRKLERRRRRGIVSFVQPDEGEFLCQKMLADARLLALILKFDEVYLLERYRSGEEERLGALVRFVSPLTTALGRKVSGMC